MFAKRLRQFGADSPKCGGHLTRNDMKTIPTAFQQRLQFALRPRYVAAVQGWDIMNSLHKLGQLFLASHRRSFVPHLR
jgi:hypothetical protein